MISGNLTEYLGKKVVDFSNTGDIADFATISPRVSVSWNDEIQLPDLLARLLDEPGVEKTEGLVIGSWFLDGGEGPPMQIVQLLFSNAHRLPQLRGLFFGDIVSEQNEISWINQGDVSALWGAFPNLEEFTIRGTNGLRMGPIKHPKLRKLTIESGGLPAAVLREALDAQAPLEHFEVWMGDENYGASSAVSDFTKLLAGDLFPNLKTLALRNCAYTDDLAEALAAAPVLDRIEKLDLSMGTLTDRGAKALIEGGKLGGLESLDISHHYLSNEVVETLKGAVKELTAEYPQDADVYKDETYYYVAVSE